MLLKLLRNDVYFQVRSCSSLCESVPKIPNFYNSPNPNCETRILKVAIIGLPNAGKSTFINNLVDRRVRNLN